MSLINISNLTFCYDGSYDNIFEEVSFQIDTNWKLGFTGRNGRGKTTFLNLLLGKYEYRGIISSNVTFDYFPFEIKDATQDTIDVIGNIYGTYEPWRLNKELSLLEVQEDVLYRSFDTLSKGEQTKVMLAALFIKDNHFLLIDEPTNHLDAEGRLIVRDYLKGKKGFILVSHDRVFLDHCIDHILSINKNNIEIQKGNFTSWQENKELQDNYELDQNEKLIKDIKRLSAAAKRTKNWSDQVEQSKFGEGVADRGYVGHKAAKMMKRSKVVESRQQKALDEKSNLLKNIETAEPLMLKPMKYMKSTLIEVTNLSISYEEKQVCNFTDFTIKNGDRAAIIGKNGSGKSSILKLLIGEKITYTGEIELGNNLQISYISQDTSYLKGSLKEFATENKINESLLKSILRKLDFSRIQLEKDLSGGQKKKVLLARSLCQPAHIYIWDEPLNFIDVLSRIQIEELILEYQPTMLFVEHDHSFVESIATKYITL